MQQVFWFGYVKKLEIFRFQFFVGDVISGVGLGLFGRDYQALGTNTKSQFSDSSFWWKLGYNEFKSP